jgi:hypothetical protein
LTQLGRLLLVQVEPEQALVPQQRGVKVLVELELESGRQAQLERRPEALELEASIHLRKR